MMTDKRWKVIRTKVIFFKTFSLNGSLAFSWLKLMIFGNQKLLLISAKTFQLIFNSLSVKIFWSYKFFRIPIYWSRSFYLKKIKLWNNTMIYLQKQKQIKSRLLIVCNPFVENSLRYIQLTKNLNTFLFTQLLFSKDWIDGDSIVLFIKNTDSFVLCVNFILTEDIKSQKLEIHFGRTKLFYRK